MIDKEKANDLAERILAGCLEASKETWEGWVTEFRALPGQDRVACWTIVAGAGTHEGRQKAKACHPHLANLVLEVFNVPAGTPGIGVMPSVKGRQLPSSSPIRAAELVDEFMNKSDKKR